MSSNSSSSFSSIEMDEVKEFRIDEGALLSLTESVGKKISEGSHKTKSISSAHIYRVPEQLRKLKESAYTPRLISIGPLHSNDNHILISPLQNIKMSYVNSLLCRITGGSKSSDESKFPVLKKCLSEMKQSIEDARKCYAEEVDDLLDEEMLVIDGCFIIELVYRSYLIKYCKGKSVVAESNKEEESSRDPISCGNLSMTSVAIQHDLLLFENQLPFFVLEKLFSLMVLHGLPGHTHRLSLPDYVLSFFFDINYEHEASTRQRKSGEVNYYHLLHIVHSYYHPGNPMPNDEVPIKWMPSASDLEFAGVKFRANVVNTGEDLFKFKFSEPKGPSRWFYRAHFEIPTLCIFDNTEPFFRNLIAFEQYCPGVPSYFTSYAFLMDTLINTPKDVQVLEKAGIIRNCLGASEDACDLFNKLCKEIFLGEFYFAQTTIAVSQYSERWCSAAMAELRRKYFSNPWSFIVFVAGSVSFVMSLVKFFRGHFQ